MRFNISTFWISTHVRPVIYPQTNPPVRSYPSTNPPVRIYPSVGPLVTCFSARWPRFSPWSRFVEIVVHSDTGTSVLRIFRFPFQSSFHRFRNYLTEPVSSLQTRRPEARPIQSREIEKCINQLQVCSLFIGSSGDHVCTRTNFRDIRLPFFQFIQPRPKNVRANFATRSSINKAVNGRSGLSACTVTDPFYTEIVSGLFSFWI
jgi:hypothetical protein